MYPNGVIIKITPYGVISYKPCVPNCGTTQVLLMFHQVLRSMLHSMKQCGKSEVGTVDDSDRRV